MLAQKLVLSYITKIAAQLLQMIALFIVARIVGPGVLGTLAFGLAFVSMFLFVADLGLTSAHVKLISEGQDEASSIGTFSVLKTGVNILFALVVFGYYLIQKYVLGIAFESSEQETVIFIYLIITFIGQFFRIPGTTFAAKTEQAKQDIPIFLQTFLFQLFRVIAALIGLRAIGIAFSNLLAVLLVIPVYFYLFKDYKVGKYSRELAKKYFAISLPVLIIIIVQAGMYSTDRVILQYLSNSVEVGYYSAGFSISQFIKLIESSAGLLFFPLFSNLLARGEYEKLNSDINKYERFNVVFILPLVAAVSISSDVVVKIALGKEFAGTVPVLGLLSISMYVSLVNLPYINLISGKGLFKLSAIIYVCCLPIYVITTYFLVSPSFFGLKGIGIALSLIIVNIALGLLFVYNAKKKVPEIKIVKDKILFAYGIGLSLVYLLVYRLLPEGFILHIISSSVFLVAYFVIGYMLKLFKREDYRMAMELLNSKKMLNYINKEIANKN